MGPQVVIVFALGLLLMLMAVQRFSRKKGSEVEEAQSATRTVLVIALVLAVVFTFWKKPITKDFIKPQVAQVILEGSEGPMELKRGEVKIIKDTLNVESVSREGFGTKFIGEYRLELRDGKGKILTTIYLSEDKLREGKTLYKGDFRALIAYLENID